MHQRIAKVHLSKRREAIASWNHDRIERALSKKGIKWSFNPPAGSHHGGAWERMIWMIRKILCSVLRQQTLDDEGFHTVLCEAEAMLNDRPITRLSEDPNDLEALTPNHLLLLKGKPVLPPGLFDKGDVYARRRWKQTQCISDLFWKRWICEYFAFTGASKIEPGEEEFFSWRPGHGCGLHSTTWVVDARKSPGNLP